MSENEKRDQRLGGQAKAVLSPDRNGPTVADFERALVLSPDSHELLNGLGEVLAREQRYDEALACFDGLLAIAPSYLPALNNRGLVLWALNHQADAIMAFDKAIATGVSDAALYHNRGNAYLALNLSQRAVEDFDKALAIAPTNAETHRSRGHALCNLKRLDEAAGSYMAALAQDPRLPYVMGYAAMARAQLCDWSDYESTVRRMSEEVRLGRPACDPLAFLCLIDDPASQLACAKSFVASNYATATSPTSFDGKKPHERLRVAYLSADFHEHATAYLVAELFELHDRSRFEIFGISFGPDSTGPMRSRLRAATDRFLDIRDLSDPAAADLLRDLEVDIAVDLKGHTQFARPGIFARRGAPVQVGFLGYPGTTGAGFIDYIIGDEFVIPAGDESLYVESVVRLPHSYQVNDSMRPISSPSPSRAEEGLPERGIVFCCFNASYKITPAIFDVWMRLLARVEGGVLWLLGANASAEGNLRREAQRRGIDPGRLVFARWKPLSEHLARHSLADLFIDTVPCNAHTTASDALWAGLPVLTCVGKSFAARVAGSLVLALRLPELITTSLQEYEQRAVVLAESPALLNDLRQRLRRERQDAPLFRTDRFRRHIESAYLTMWAAYQRGERPHAFSVASISEAGPPD